MIHLVRLDASYQLGMVNPKPCFIYNVGGMVSWGLETTKCVQRLHACRVLSYA